MQRKTAALFVFAGGLALATAVGAQGQTGAPKAGAMTSGAKANAPAGVNASATASALADLKTGQTVKDSTGATLGKVSRIEKSTDGAISSVHVATTAGGKTMHLAPGTLSVSNGVVTTTATPKPK